VNGSIHGTVLHVDLSTGFQWLEHPAPEFYRKYGGGSAMGLYYLLKEMPRGAEPLGPANVLTFFTGIPTGLMISGQSRLTVNARSPISGAIGDSQCGGFFPAAFKGSGFDGAVISGASPKPVYLYLHNGQAELRDASHLWGMETVECEEAIKAELGDPKVEVAQIGPAGEKLVRFAAIMNMVNRANGRTGMGAVMGSKNLKAVVVKSSLRIEPANKAALTKMQREGTRSIDQYPDVKGLGLNGTADVVAFQNSIGSLPTRNYSEGQFEGFETLAGDHMTDTILKERDTCFSCTVRCKRVVETEYNGTTVQPVYGGPEYETLGTMGSYCAIGNLEAVALANQICNRFGMDTIAAGATVAYAMECFERGLITLQDTGGIELRYGNAEAMVAVVEQIGRREGIGDRLAEGSARFADTLAPEALDFLVTVKKTELPAHMPQAKKSLGLIYAVNPFGADHQSSEHDPMIEEGGMPHYYTRLAQIGLTQVLPPGSMNNEKVRFAYLGELFYSAMDTYNLCQFVWGPSWQLFGPQDMANMLTAATGWDIDVDEILTVGARRLNLMRAFNAREGFTRSDDVLPKRFSKTLKGSGPTAGISMEPSNLESHKDVYYQLAGWDRETGNPTPERLKELGLEWVA
jgi:aldehyde:ferredoxin oxidoreductase